MKNRGASRMPPAPHSMVEIPKVIANTRYSGIPTMRAPVGSWATARMLMPVRVLAMKTKSTTATTAAKMNIASSCQLMVKPPTVTLPSRKAGRDLVRAPKITSTRLSRNTASPRVASSTLKSNSGRLRRGRMITRSTAMPMRNMMGKNDDEDEEVVELGVAHRDDPGQIRSPGEEGAVAVVEYPAHPVAEGEAHRHQEVDDADGEPGDEYFYELSHLRLSHPSRA